MYKEVLDNTLLQDPVEGANYFKNTLMQYFPKGTTIVYLRRLLSFFNHRRNNSEFLICDAAMVVAHLGIGSCFRISSFFS